MAKAKRHPGLISATIRRLPNLLGGALGAIGSGFNFMASKLTGKKRRRSPRRKPATNPPPAPQPAPQAAPAPANAQTTTNSTPAAATPQSQAAPLNFPQAPVQPAQPAAMPQGVVKVEIVGPFPLPISGGGGAQPAPVAPQPAPQSRMQRLGGALGTMGGMVFDRFAQALPPLQLLRPLANVFPATKQPAQTPGANSPPISPLSPLPASSVASWPTNMQAPASSVASNTQLRSVFMPAPSSAAPAPRSAPQGIGTLPSSTPGATGVLGMGGLKDFQDAVREFKDTVRDMKQMVQDQKQGGAQAGPQTGGGFVPGGGQPLAKTGLQPHQPATRTPGRAAATTALWGAGLVRSILRS